MATSGAAGLLSRRSTLAGSVSLALHGGVVLLAVALLGTRVARSPRRIALTSVEIVSPVPLPPRPAAAPAPAMAPAQTVASAAPSPAVRSTARQGRTASPPSRAVSATEALDLKVSYDDRDNFAGKRSADTPPDGIEAARGINADSRRQLQDSLANVQIPVPPPVSRARAPRPRHNYHQLRLHSVRRFAGLTIKLLLTIDAQGRVSDVELTQGVDGQVDRRVVELARRFEFEPALDEVGAPVASNSKWNIEIIDDDNGQLRNSMERGYY